MDSKMSYVPRVMDFAQRFQAWQAQRDDTGILIRDLIMHCNEIEKELKNESEKLYHCKLDLDNATDTRRQLQQRMQNYESKHERLTKENEALKNRNPYIMVLIDGDGLIFQDKWIKQGMEGGKKAAYALRNLIADTFCQDTEDVEIVAKVVANLSGLTRAMQRDGGSDSQSHLKDFTLGFTQAKASFDFIDVGYGKERADSKIKELTRWNLRNHNCKQIVLGISHDSGYAPFLDEIFQDDFTRQRISVLEGVSTVKEIVATQVDIVQAEAGIFRREKLMERSVSGSILNSVSISGMASAAAAAASAAAQAMQGTTVSCTSSPTPSVSSGPARTPTASYAGIASAASPPPQITLPFTTKPAPSRQKSSQSSVSQLMPPQQPDWNPGPRGLDEPIRVNVLVLETIKKRKDTEKLCNNHYLRGLCAKQDMCQFVHDYKPSEDEIKAIAVLARHNPCSSGQYCEMGECIYGHHCPSVRDGMCMHPFCKFSEDSHPPGTKFKNNHIRAN